MAQKQKTIKLFFLFTFIFIVSFNVNALINSTVQGILVYSNNTRNNSVYYQIWNGTNFSKVMQMPDADGVNWQTIVRASNKRDEFVAFTKNNNSVAGAFSRELRMYIYNGTCWGNQTSCDSSILIFNASALTGLAIINLSQQDFDAQYENVSGKNDEQLLIVYENKSETPAYTVYNTTSKTFTEPLSILNSQSSTIHAGNLKLVPMYDAASGYQEIVLLYRDENNDDLLAAVWNSSNSSWYCNTTITRTLDDTEEQIDFDGVYQVNNRSFMAVGTVSGSTNVVYANRTLGACDWKVSGSVGTAEITTIVSTSSSPSSGKNDVTCIATQDDAAGDNTNLMISSNGSIGPNSANDASAISISTHITPYVHCMPFGNGSLAIYRDSSTTNVLSYYTLNGKTTTWSTLNTYTPTKVISDVSHYQSYILPLVNQTDNLTMLIYGERTTAAPLNVIIYNATAGRFTYEALGWINTPAQANAASADSWGFAARTVFQQPMAADTIFVKLNNPPNFTNFVFNNTNTSVILNASINYTSSNLIDTFLYGANSTSQLDIGNNSLLGIFKGISNTLGYYNISYNWTSPVLQPENGMVLLLHFDNRSEFGEDNRRYADFTRYNNATLNITSGSGSINSSGKFGYGLTFQTITQSLDGPRVNSTTWGMYDKNLSVSLWINPSITYNGSISATGGLFYIGDDDSSNDAELSILSSGYLNFRLFNGASFINLIGTNGNWTMNKWYNIVVTFNTSGSRFIYVNGQLDTSATGALTRGSSFSKTLSIGNTQSQISGFNGTIDDFAVWNRSLNSDEILDIYRLKNTTWFWKVNATDSTTLLSGENKSFQFNISSSKIQQLDTILPIINCSLNMSEFQINKLLNITCNITDETGLSSANITYNMSGFLTKVNYTLSGTSTQVNNVTSINTGWTTVINFTAYATDTSNNVKQNSTLITILNTRPTQNQPFLTGNLSNSTDANITSFPQGGFDGDGHRFINLTTFTINKSSQIMTDTFYLSFDENLTNFTDFYERKPTNISGFGPTLSSTDEGVFGKSTTFIKQSTPFSLDYNSTGLFNDSFGTIQMWVKPNGTLITSGSSTEAGSGIFTAFYNTTYFFDILHYAEGGCCTPGMQVITTNETQVRKDLTSDAFGLPDQLLAANQWTLITVTWNNSVLKLYLNDSLVLNRSDYGTVNWTKFDHFQIGGQDWDFGDGTGGDFNGSIDEFRIKNYALTSQQVKYDYEQRGYNLSRLAPNTTEIGDNIYSTVKPVDISGESGLAMNSTNITISATPTAVTTCDCPASGNWEINDGTICELTTLCDIRPNKLRINDGGLRIQSGGKLRADGCYSCYGCPFYVDRIGGGGLFCG